MFFLMKQIYLKCISCLSNLLEIVILFNVFNCHHDQDESERDLRRYCIESNIIYYDRPTVKLKKNVPFWIA